MLMNTMLERYLMKIDTFLKIGHSHTICQDYILSGTDPCPFIILADGCSQADDSDIGARILCHSALGILKSLQSYLASVDPDELGQWIINGAMRAKKYFHTKIDCLDATLTIAYKFEKNYYVYMYGDGVIYRTDHEGNTRPFRRYYKPNAPAYLRYRIDGYNNYKESNVASFMEIGGLCDQVEDNVMEPFFHKFSEDNVKSLVIASDGIESFIYKDELMYKTMFNILKQRIINGKLEPLQHIIVPPKTVEIDFLEVCEEMTNFKLTSGPFLKRRVKKVMKNYLKEGFVNDDDLSIGCFYEE
jgi:hypothetical protein